MTDLQTMRNTTPKQYYVYLMSNVSRTLYVGVTNNLERRVSEHRAGTFQGFTSRYKMRMLVYYEMFDDILVAIAREKQIKGWLRSKKIAIIEAVNPNWRDLSEDW